MIATDKRVLHGFKIPSLKPIILLLIHKSVFIRCMNIKGRKIVLVCLIAFI